MPQPQTLYKLIILYMLDSVNVPLTNSQIANFMLEHEYTNYFHFQETLSEMVGAHLVREKKIQETTYYKITEEGRTTLSYFTNDIAGTIREEIRAYLAENGAEIRSRTTILADYDKNTNHEYTARCQVKERQSILISLEMDVPTEDAAKSICRKWKSKCQEIYDFLIEELL